MTRENILSITALATLFLTFAACSCQAQFDGVQSVIEAAPDFLVSCLSWLL